VAVLQRRGGVEKRGRAVGKGEGQGRRGVAGR